MKNTLYSLLALSVLVAIALTLIPTATLYQGLVKLERKLAGFEPHRIQVGDQEIAYLRGGQGEPLLLLHGFGADKDNWNRIGGYLSEHYDVIALDLPGFGNSSKDVNGQYDVFSQVERVRQFAASLGLQRFHIAGNSMGGYIAGNLAAKYPEQVRTLWLLNPLGVMGSQTSEMFLAIKRGENPKVLARDKQEFNALFDFLFVDPPYVPGAMLTYLAEQAALSAGLNRIIFDQIHNLKDNEPQFDSPLDQALNGYAGPLLVTWGDQDRVLHVSGAAVIKELVPHSTVAIMQNVGHLPMLEQPLSTSESFIEFARE